MHTALRFLTVAAILTLVLLPPTADAGCGCEKPPPVPADLRPSATWSGMEVTIFHPSLVPGEVYRVEFASGTTPVVETVEGQAVWLRDLADGSGKAQIRVVLPSMPVGPTAVSVSAAGDPSPVVTIGDDRLTVVGPPVAVPSDTGGMLLAGFQAAVSRDGVMYIGLDITGVTDPMVFHAQALGYPLRFSEDDVTFSNTQGFVMQQFDQNMPGLFAIEAAEGSRDSDVLQYSRHEFNTYFLQHFERKPHEVDAHDSAWHLDGTPHIDHDHLILSIGGVFENGLPPAPGATTPFDLSLTTASLFHDGLRAATSISMQHWTKTQSFDSTDPTWTGEEGDIVSDGSVTLRSQARVHGDATALSFNITGQAVVGGDIVYADESHHAIMPIQVPAWIEDLGDFEVRGRGGSETLTGPASFRASSFTLKDSADLVIDNTAGPVTVYVTGNVKIDGHSQITTLNNDPERFALYVSGGGNVTIEAWAEIYGVIYAPESLINLKGNGKLYGAFVGDKVNMTERAKVYYDIALRGPRATGAETPTATPTETSTPTTQGGDPGASGAEPPPADVPDTVEITRSFYRNSNGQLTVWAETAAAPAATLTISIEGFVDDAAMTYRSNRGRYEYKIRTDTDLDGRMATVVSDRGSSDSAIIE